MSNSLQQTPAVKPVDVLVARLEAEAYKPGTPPHVPLESKWWNAWMCQRARCVACGERGLTYKPFHRGTSYRIAAVCPNCGHAEEY